MIDRDASGSFYRLNPKTVQIFACIFLRMSEMAEAALS